jgi:hypothetical protein
MPSPPRGLPLPGVSRTGRSGPQIVQPSAKAIAEGLASPMTPVAVPLGNPVARRPTQNAPKFLDPHAPPRGEGPAGRPTPKTGRAVSPSERAITEEAYIESVDQEDYAFSKVGQSNPRTPGISEVQALQSMFTIFMGEVAKGADPQQAANHILSRFRATVRDRHGKIFYDYNQAEVYAHALSFPSDHDLEEDDLMHRGTDGLSFDL